jgi:hypothetical protein
MAFIVQVLAFVNLITNLFEKIKQFVLKSWYAATQAHIPDVWVFTHRNSVPLIRKEAITNTLSFYPETQKFFKESTTRKSMDDLVTAEVLDASGILVTDITEFLHTVRWDSIAPSVYELVLVFFLLRDIILSQGHISSYVLRVMTIDTETLDIPLNDARAWEGFIGWGHWSSSSSASAAAEVRQEEI